MVMKEKPDLLLLLAPLLGVPALFFTGLFVFRENRLDSGSPIPALEANPQLFAVLLAVFTMVLVLAFVKDRVLLSGTLLFISGTVLMVLLTFGTSLVMREALRDASEYARTAEGPAFWIMMFAVYIIFYRLYSRFKGRTVLRYVSTSMPLLVLLAWFLSGMYKVFSIFVEFELRKGRFVFLLIEHIQITAFALLFGSLFGMGIGLLALKRKRLESILFSMVNIIQTVPSLAMFGLLIAPLAILSRSFPVLREFGIKGIGFTPALIALVLYSLLPIARNTFAGFKSVETSIKQAGRGMGMSSLHLFFKLELPLALPVVLAGIRVAGVLAVGNAALVYLIGAGGLGTFIFQGLDAGAVDLMLLGTMPVILLAVGFDLLMKQLTVLVSPRKGGSQ